MCKLDYKLHFLFAEWLGICSQLLLVLKFITIEITYFTFYFAYTSVLQG
jgi:hypothetical protein